MYTVLLVDDEFTVTDSLKLCVPWESLGIEEIYTASDGNQALELFHSHHIDLLITDIKMPRMDGLSLLKQVRMNYPDTRCILLTAYGEFEYARDSLRLGVENYLLKPLQINEIIETIENAIDNIYASRDNKELLFRENVLRRWLNGNISGEELGERASILNINIFQSAYCAVCLRKTSKAFSLSNFGAECIKLFGNNYDCSSVWDNHGRYILIIGARSISPQELYGIFEKTAQKFGLLDKIDIAIGSVVSNSEDLPISFRTASELSDQNSEFTETNIKICPLNVLTASDALPNIDYRNLSPIIQKAVDYIQNRYSESVSIKEFCATHIITTAYFGYLFKKETHIFFNNYLNSYRISKAIEMLSSTSYKINEIAFKVGFSSISYFVSTFRKYTGISPQKYREQCLYYEIKK